MTKLTKLKEHIIKKNQTKNESPTPAFYPLSALEEIATSHIFVIFLQAYHKALLLLSKS